MASSNYVPLLVSILVLVTLVAPSTSNPTGKLTHESLKRVCAASGFPTICLRTLRHDPQARSLNLGNLTLSYVDKARTRTSSTLPLIETLIGKTQNPELIYKLRRCSTHYGFAQTELSRAKRRLKSGNYTGIGDLALFVFTRYTDCDAEFLDKKFPRPIELDRSNQDVMHFVGIVYGLATELILP